MSTVKIKEVSEQTNWDGIASIFNYYIRTSTAAFRIQEIGSNHFYDDWKANPTYPFYEITDEDKVIGFGSMNAFRAAKSMNSAAVFTYFLSPENTGKGIGQKLLDRLIKDGLTMGKTNFLVSISSENEGSLNFHKKNGFTECGRFHSVGKKFGRQFDMVWMQRIEK
mgnify:CR=1 FL=1